jgi:hypothetical protein
VSGTLALDLSKSRTGWAVLRDGAARAEFGHWRLGSEYTSNGGVFAKLHEHMADVHQVCPFDRIYFEAPITPAHLQGYTTIQTLKLLGGLAAHAESFGHAYRCRTVKEVNIEHWRPFFLGRMEVAEAKAIARRARKAGDAKASARQDLKDLTMLRCRQLGFAPRYDDEADAIGVLDYACELQGIIPPWRADEVLRPLLAAGDGA